MVPESLTPFISRALAVGREGKGNHGRTTTARAGRILVNKKGRGYNTNFHSRDAYSLFAKTGSPRSKNGRRRHEVEKRRGLKGQAVSLKDVPILENAVTPPKGNRARLGPGGPRGEKFAEEVPSRIMASARKKDFITGG